MTATRSKGALALLNVTDAEANALPQVLSVYPIREYAYALRIYVFKKEPFEEELIRF